MYYGGELVSAFYFLCFAIGALHKRSREGKKKRKANVKPNAEL